MKTIYTTHSWKNRAERIKEFSLIDYIEEKYPNVAEGANRIFNGKRKMRIRCPFHDDKRPSMLVDDKKYHCFVCGKAASGDIIDFEKQICECGFKKAITNLESWYGIIPEKKEISREKIMAKHIIRDRKKLEEKFLSDLKFHVLHYITELSERNPEFFDKILYIMLLEKAKQSIKKEIK